MSLKSTASSKPPAVRIAIVGGGPSGLVTAKTLLDGMDRWGGEGFEVEVSLFEKEENVGGTFSEFFLIALIYQTGVQLKLAYLVLYSILGYRSYHSATLVSSKQLTSFSDFRMPLEHTDHLTLSEYCEYLESYVHHFNLAQRCRLWRLNCRVVDIRRAKTWEDGNHVLSWEDLETRQKGTEHYDALALCTGLHVEPSYPEIPGLPLPANVGRVAPATKAHADEESRPHLSEAQAKIRSLHSSSFKDPAIFRDQRVLILGTGETGMDLGYLAVKNGAKEIVMCTRGGFLSFPAVLSDFVVLGIKFEGKLPIDGLISNLFETSHVAPWVAQSHLRWHVSDFVLRNVVLPVLTGTKAGCSQWVGELPPEKQGRAYVFLNKSAKAMPYINRAYKKRNRLAETFAHYLDPPDYSPNETGIDLAPFPHHVRPDGVIEFQRNGRKEDLHMRDRKFVPDICVYATGYSQVGA